MSSSVIDSLNQIRITEGQSFLLTIYYCKGYPIGDENINIAVVDEAPEITVVDQDTYQDPQYQYYITEVDIDQYEHPDQH